jgi:tight adherence protein C
VTPALLIALIGVFVMVAVLAGATTAWLLARTAPEQRRLRTMAAGGGSMGILAQTPVLAQGPDPALQRATKFLPKSAAEMSRLQKRLTRAGFPHYRAVVLYVAAELTLPLVAFLAVTSIVGLRTGLIPALLAAGAAYVVPSFYIGHRTTLRKKAIRNGLPDALDLLTVCVEAGSALDQALQKTSVELQISHPVLAEELRLITTEVRAGKPRLEAFRNFAQRTGVDEVRTLVSMLTQTDRFGTSIGDALRVHSETSRTKRRQEAEERANKVGVKLVFPLALCLFPALYVVCFGPVVVKVYRAFFEGQP